MPFPAAELPADFYSTTHFTDRIIEFIDAGRSGAKPFFAYLAYTAPHWPLQAPAEDIAAQAGRYDTGYEVIAARRLARMKQLGLLPADFVANPGLASAAQGGRGKKRWSELSRDEQASQARRMEVYAAMVSQMDRQIGRVIRHLKDTGAYDNTLIVFMSDNGADPGPARPDRHADHSLANMGRPGSTISYGERWTEVSSTPLRLWKGRTGAEGAISSPAIVRMPRQRSARAPLRSPMYVTDVLPTLLDVAGIAVPAGRYAGRRIEPVSGVSFRALLESDRPATHGPRTLFAGEMLGMRFVRKDDWKLSLAFEPGDTPARIADVPWRSSTSARTAARRPTWRPGTPTSSPACWPSGRPMPPATA